MFAVIAERPWFEGRHCDTVLCLMHFLASRPLHAKQIDVQTYRHFLGRRHNGDNKHIIQMDQYRMVVGETAEYLFFLLTALPRCTTSESTSYITLYLYMEDEEERIRDQLSKPSMDMPEGDSFMFDNIDSFVTLSRLNKCACNHLIAIRGTMSLGKNRANGGKFHEDPDDHY
jgi:hypothetical protein